jgi:hypothetical protein
MCSLRRGAGAESVVAKREPERPAVTQSMMEAVCERENLKKALRRVKANKGSLGEQKAVVDHVAEKVAQLECMLQEARNTLRTLHHEREVAERIEQGIKQLRSRAANRDDRSPRA